MSTEMPPPYELQAEDVGGTCQDGLKPNPKPNPEPNPEPKPESDGSSGGRRGGIKAKTLRRMLKKAGLKTSGKKATLTKRCKKAHLMRGGHYGSMASSPGAGGPAGYPFASGMVAAGRPRRARGGHWGAVNSFGSMEEPAPASGQVTLKGGRRHGIKTKTLKKLLKKAGLKVSGKKSTLRARAKKAHLVRGGLIPSSGSPEEAAYLPPYGAPWGAASS